MAANAATPANAAPITTETVAAQAVAPMAAKKITTKKTTATMHLRAKASKSSKSVKIVPKNTKLVIKRVSGKWHQVSYKGKTGWVSGKYLKTVSVKTVKTPSRSQSGSSVSQNKGSRYTSATVNLRTGAGTSHRVRAVIPFGSKVGYQGTKSGWSKVSTSKGTGWIKNTYLATTKPGSIDPRIKKINSLVKSKYGSARGTGVYGYGGYRPGSAGHSSGRASDLMIRNYKTSAGKKHGDKVANYLIKNRKSLGISYLIWKDRIWFPGSGWEEYSEGGRWGQQFTGKWNDTTKHLDHVHVEVTKR